MTDQTGRQYNTVFGSLDQYNKGGVEVISDNPKYYAFSNMFEVASAARPYEKVAVAKNLEYVLEVIRAEGTSEWRATPHDEFALVMDGSVELNYLTQRSHWWIPMPQDPSGLTASRMEIPWAGFRPGKAI